MRIKSIYLSEHKHSLVFTALSETDKCIWGHECWEWIKNEKASAKISLCHCLTLCFGGRSAMEQLTGIINVFYPEDSTGENKQPGGVLDSGLGPTYHSYHLQVLQIRPFSGQQLLGNEVGPICWKPLQRQHNRERMQLNCCTTSSSSRIWSLSSISACVETISRAALQGENSTFFYEPSSGPRLRRRCERCRRRWAAGWWAGKAVGHWDCGCTAPATSDRWPYRGSDRRTQTGEDCWTPHLLGVTEQPQQEEKKKIKLESFTCLHMLKIFLLSSGSLEFFFFFAFICLGKAWPIVNMKSRT